MISRARPFSRPPGPRFRRQGSFQGQDFAGKVVFRRSVFQAFWRWDSGSRVLAVGFSLLGSASRVLVVGLWQGLCSRVLAPGFGL